jgi:hypothetical protein
MTMNEFKVMFNNHNKEEVKFVDYFYMSVTNKQNFEGKIYK